MRPILNWKLAESHAHSRIDPVRAESLIRWSTNALRTSLNPIRKIGVLLAVRLYPQTGDHRDNHLRTPGEAEVIAYWRFLQEEFLPVAPVCSICAQWSFIRAPGGGGQISVRCLTCMMQVSMSVFWLIRRRAHSVPKSTRPGICPRPVGLFCEK